MWLKLHPPQSHPLGSDDVTSEIVPKSTKAWDKVRISLQIVCSSFCDIIKRTYSLSCCSPHDITYCQRVFQIQTDNILQSFTLVSHHTLSVSTFMCHYRPVYYRQLVTGCSWAYPSHRLHHSRVWDDPPMKCDCPPPSHHHSAAQTTFY